MSKRNNNNFKKPFFINPEYPDKKCTKSFVSIDSFTGRCPKCGNILYEDFTFLPVSTNEFMHITGYLCENCFCFYTGWASKIRDIICKNNKLAEFSVDGLSGNELLEYEKTRINNEILKRKAQEERLIAEKKIIFYKRRDRLRSIKEGLLLIPITDCDSDTVTEIILVKKKSAANPKKHIFYYLSDEGKSFLYTVFYPANKKMDDYKSSKYHINDKIIYKTSEDAHNLPKFLKSELIRVINEQLVWEKTEEERIEREKKEDLLLRKTPLFKKDSSIILIPIEFTENQERVDIVIVKNEKDEDIENNYFYYGSDGGKEFLSAAFAKARGGLGYYNGKYTVYDTPLFSDENTIKPTCDLIPNEIYIQPRGGFSDSIKNRKFELVYVLVYSPFSLRYEFLKATYDKSKNYCFTDICYYRQFVEKYGKPVEIFDEIYFTNGNTKYGYNFSFENMNEESLLKAYGYNVSAAENLTAMFRRTLLEEVIDLEIMTRDNIISFLGYLIATRENRISHTNAVAKWESDRNYIMNYEERPKRFIIPKVPRLF